MEEARHDQRVKPLLTHLRQQVLREQIFIPVSDSQLTTEELWNNTQIANNSSHKHEAQMLRWFVSEQLNPVLNKNVKNASHCGFK